MMRPNAAAAYLPVQNMVADDFTRALQASLDKDGEVPEFNTAVQKYAMECEYKWPPLLSLCLLSMVILQGEMSVAAPDLYLDVNSILAAFGTVCYGSRLGLFHPNQQDAGSDANAMMKASAAMFEAVQKTSFAFPWYNYMRTPMYEQFIRGRRHCDRSVRNIIIFSPGIRNHTEEGKILPGNWNQRWKKTCVFSTARRASTLTREWSREAETDRLTVVLTSWVHW